MADSATPIQTSYPHVAFITRCSPGHRTCHCIAKLRLIEDGLNITIADLKLQRTNLDCVVDEVRANLKGRRCLILECDISQEEEVQHMFNALDIMVVNVGQILVKPMVDSTLADFDMIFDTNVHGMFLCLCAAAQAMIKRGASSVPGKKGMPFNSIYCASKICHLIVHTASELGSHSTTVNAYALGPADTLLLQGSAEEYPKQIGLPDGKTFIQSLSFFTGKDSAYTTGQTITVDEGSWMDRSRMKMNIMGIMTW
ncbi:NAD(P)-binding protein [Suillus lakei]|nr:NAD(P)-binding protein [Suillus lakei]